MKHRKKHLGLAAETGKGHSARRDAISGGSDDGQKRVTESPASAKQLPRGYPAPTWSGNVRGGSLARGPQAAAAPKVKFRAPTRAGKISGGSALRGRKSPAAPKRCLRVLKRHDIDNARATKTQSKSQLDQSPEPREASQRTRPAEAGDNYRPSIARSPAKCQAEFCRQSGGVFVRCPLVGSPPPSCLRRSRPRHFGSQSPRWPLHWASRRSFARGPCLGGTLVLREAAAVKLVARRAGLHPADTAFPRKSAMPRSPVSRNSAKSDSEGIRAPAGGAQWISSPSPWPLGHAVFEL